MSPKISLDQWAAVVSVVESGSYAKAGERLHKTQSTLSYSVQKLERVLKVKVFEIKGRRAVLTEAGKLLYLRGKSLVEEASRLERAAAALTAGWEPELRLAVEITFPTWLLLQCLTKFGAERPEARIELYETVLGGTAEMLLEGKVNLAIGPVVPQGFTGEPVAHLRFVLAAHPDHPLHRLNRALTLADLKAHRHLVIRETGSKRAAATSVIANQRWTVSNKATSIRAASLGLGYSWFPEESIREEIESGKLKPLPLRDGAERFGSLYLIFADRDAAGPGARRLAEIIRDQCRDQGLMPDAGASR